MNDFIRDVTIQHHGSIMLIVPNDPQAVAWLDEHVDEHVVRWAKHAVPCEPRYVDGLVKALQDAGFTVEMVL